MTQVKILKKLKDEHNKVNGYQIQNAVGIVREISLPQLQDAVSMGKVQIVTEFINDILATPNNRGTISIDRHVVPRKGKASMRDYSKMTDEEFIRAYETPLTLDEEQELHSIAIEQIKNAQVHEVTRERLDAIVQNAKLRRC